MSNQKVQSKRNFDTISEVSTKPPLKNNGKILDEPRKGRKKRDDNVLKLTRKKKEKRRKELEQKFLSSMTNSFHPALQLADESIKKINKQLNSNSLHSNSV